MPKHTSISIAVALFVLPSVGSAQQFFTDRAAFLSKIDPNYYEEDFNGWAPGEPLDGHQPEWEAPGMHGFDWLVSAPGPGNQMLYSLDSAISTSSYTDPLNFQFSGNPVYAFGGDFWGTQYDGQPQSTEIQFETDTGQVFNQVVSGRSFLGFVSNVPLTSVTISTSGAKAAWATADSIITGDLDPDGDLDGDGMSNYAEQLAGTDPGDPNSNLRVTEASFSGSDFIISFAAVAGKTYRLEFKAPVSGLDWMRASIQDQTATSTGTMQFTDPIGQTPAIRFYRIALVQSASNTSGIGAGKPKRAIGFFSKKRTIEPTNQRSVLLQK